jgi:hypothetical protein
MGGSFAVDIAAILPVGGVDRKRRTMNRLAKNVVPLKK